MCASANIRCEGGNGEEARVVDTLHARTQGQLETRMSLGVFQSLLLFRLQVLGSSCPIY